MSQHKQVIKSAVLSKMAKWTGDQRKTLLGFHFQEMPRTGHSMNTENRSGLLRIGQDCELLYLMVTELLLLIKKRFKRYTTL